MGETEHFHPQQTPVEQVTTVMDTPAPVRLQNARKRKWKSWKKNRHGMPTLPVYHTHITAVIVLVICGTVLAENYTSPGVPPVIQTGPPPHRPYNDQQPIKLECRAEGNQPIEIKWFKNGKVLEGNSQTQVSGSLKINRANSSDQGYYQCQANNSFGTAMSNVTFLERIFLARDTQGSGSNASFKRTGSVGKYFVATCKKMKGNKMTFEWRKIETKGGLKECQRERGGIRVKETSRISIYEENGSLSFSNLLTEDSGTYKCFASGGRQTFGAGCFELTLDNPFNHNLVPEFMHHSRSPLDVFEGEDFHLQCFFKGNPTPNVTWHKEGGQMPRDRFSIDQKVGHRMTVKKAQLGDSGYYTCIGENVAGKSKTQRIKVRVNSRPNMTHAPVSQNVTSEQTVNFTCQGKGSPTPKITWYKNTEEIKENTTDMLILHEGGILSLKHLKEQDTATYHCNLSNPFGYVFVGAYLIVSDDFQTNVIAPAGISGEKNEENKVESPNITWALILLGVILAVILVIVVFVVIKKKRTTLSYQLGSVEPPDPRSNVGGEHAVGDRLLGQESGGSAVSV